MTLGTLPHMDSAAVDLLGEVYLQKNGKAFHRGWCKTGFALHREVDPGSLFPFLNRHLDRGSGTRGCAATETRSGNTAELSVCWAATARSMHPGEEKAGEHNVYGRTYKPTHVF